MFSSKEELIELADLTSPAKSTSKTKRRNKIDSSPTNSSTATSKGDVVNLFSVKRTPQKLSVHSDSVSQSVSDISDEIFVIEKIEENRVNSGSTYKDKISKHLKNIKQKASTSHKFKTFKGAKFAYPIERIRKENKDVDADVDSVKEKFKLNRKFAVEKERFFSRVGEETQVQDETNENEANSSEKTTQKDVGYVLPEQLSFNLKLSEKESCFIPDGKPIDLSKNMTSKTNSLEESFPQPKIRKKHMNILEKRLLLSIDDKQLFDDAGNLHFLESPISDRSKRPNSVEYNAKELSCYLPSIAKEDCNEIIIIKENILELHVAFLKFTFHPLFSIEHYFMQKLDDLYKQYTYIKENNNLLKLKNQLQKLRDARSNFEISKNGFKDGSDSKKILKINKEIKKKRNLYFEEAKKERDNLKTILDTWKTIKKVREEQKYSNTDIKLLIKKEKADSEIENEERKHFFEETLREILEERKTQLAKTEKQDEIDNSESERSSSRNHSSSTNEDRIKHELEKQFQHNFRASGEPILTLILSTGGEITKDVENKEETVRRNATLLTKIYLKILCGKIEVCKSKPIALNENFDLEIDETFSIQLVDIPEFLTVEIFEQQKGLLKKKICEINIEVPPHNISLRDSKSHKVPFEKNEIVHYKHEGIGSGINLKKALEKTNLTISAKEDPALYTAGYLEYSIGWDRASKEVKEDCLESQINLLNEVTNKNLGLNTKKLEEWLHQMPGRQEQGDSIITEYMEEYDHSLLTNNQSKFFRLSPHVDNIKFCDISEVEQNVRIKILQLRNQHEIEFDGMVVPNRVKEIPYNILADYKRRIAAEGEGLFEEDEDENEIETQRNFGKKYLKQVHIKIFQKCKNSDNNLAYESVVNEKYLIYFELMVKTLLRNFLNWFRWQPKVNQPLPIKTESKDPIRENYKIMNQVNIIIKVGNGRNVPNRKIHSEEVCDSENNTKGENSRDEVKPFVEISYGNVSVRTSASKGVNPTWNETLKLPLESQHADYLNPSSLNDSIIVNLYDEKETEIRNINRKTFTWLGGIEILLSAVCYSNCMEGSFKLKLPQVLFGYETELDKYKTKSPKASNLQSHNQHTFLHMEIKVEPNIPKLTPNMEEFPCGEVPYLQEHILKWNQTYNNSFSNRKFSALAIDANAKTTCITRYLKPLEPPQINLDEFDVTEEQCLRYVSLIPFTECNQFYQNVWLSTDQLLRFMVGSIIDHAVALTCYLLALKIDVWLLLGYGIPNGSTAYVLVREYVKETETPSYYIYDVIYNDKYNLTDTCCPLQRIYCLVNGENVWANTQRNDNVGLTRFDLNRKSDWLPLFSNKVSAPIHFINNKVSYSTRTNIEDLEIQLERKIRKKIAKLRQLDRTIWDNNLGAIFKNLLKSFEVNCMYNKNHFETLTEMNKEMSSYNVSGYIMNTAFTTVSSIVKKIKSLGIHIQREGNTTFALAVYIQVYPGQLLSIWIMIVNAASKSSI